MFDDVHESVIMPKDHICIIDPSSPRSQVLLKLADDAESASREADEYSDLMRVIGQGGPCPF